MATKRPARSASARRHPENTELRSSHSRPMPLTKTPRDHAQPAWTAIWPSPIRELNCAICSELGSRSTPSSLGGQLLERRPLAESCPLETPSGVEFHAFDLLDGAFVRSADLSDLRARQSFHQTHVACCEGDRRDRPMIDDRLQ